MMKKILAVLLTLAMCAAMFSACGSNNAPAQTDGKTAENSSTEAKTEAKKIDLSMGWWGAEGRHAYTQDLAKKYMEEHEGLTITFQPNSWDGYWEKMATQAAGNNLPTIMQMDHAFINNYSTNGLLRDLTPYVEEGLLHLDNISPELLESGRVGGKLTGVVLSQSARAVIINKNALAEAGLEMPSPDWTWEDFEQLCLDYTKKTGNPAIDDYSSLVAMMAAYLLQLDERLFSEDGTKLGYDNYEDLVPFFAMWDRLVKAGACITPDQNVTLMQLPSEQTLVATEKALLRFHSNSFPNWAQNENLVLSVIPNLEGGKFGNFAKPGMYFCVAANADEDTAREAVKFIDWWVNSEKVADVQGTDRGIPASSAICNYLLNKDDIDPISVDTFHFFDVMSTRSTVCPPPDPTCAGEITVETMNIFGSMLNGKYTPEEAAENFFNIATEILERNV